MKFRNLLLVTTVFTTLAFYACKSKTEDPAPVTGPGSDKCASKTITITADISNAIKCDNDGKLVIHAKGSTGFTYKMDNSSFVADSNFNGLPPGTYQITVKDLDGCTKSAPFVITESGTKGPNFTVIASIIGAKCNLACHATGANGSVKGIFTTDCQIVSRSGDIKSKAYDGNMGNLDAGEKDKILIWINAGGGYTD